MVLPSPNSNEQALHETKRCDVTNDDEDVHFYSITKQANFQNFKTPQFWQLLLSPFASARTSRSLVTDQHLHHFHRYVTGKHFKSAVYTLLKKASSDFSSEISCNKNLRTSKSPIPWISSDDVTDYDSVQNSLPKVHKNSSLLWDVRRQIVNDQLKPTMFDILQSDCVNLQQHLRFSTTVT